MNQRVITIFQDFKVSGYDETQIPAGYVVKQIISSAIDNANHISSSTIKNPRLAITLLLEKNEK
ncbi:hypothetical protein PJIAN_4804 [Paludibacter jiangxiensis]|uniref:Uncharacterized protein n=1 Tax=Paludibacter jiangxiensis TaxID=681398 RepID=A0A161L9N5_9BACT|nr:hypothetical protein PJIAN_4804 [Paludibacter jiangxiensis]